jgi:hypothetical protein
VALTFDGDMPAADPAREWLARVSPWLPAAEPHQQCLLRAQLAGSGDVNPYCTCPKPERCTKECCA